MSETSYRSPGLARPGACPAQDADAHPAYEGVAWHYGDPLGEQRAITEQAVVIDRSNRVVLQVSGADAPEFLNNLLSQKLDDLPVGAGTEALDLDAQGHILHALGVLRTEEGFLLDIPRPSADSLEEFLRRMVFWSAVEISRTDLGLLTLLGTSAPAGLSRSISTPLAHTDLYVPAALIDATLTELESNGVRCVGLMAWTAERVRHLLPLPEVDLDDKSIPHEVAHWVGGTAVHLHKGCYRGQETVARVENLGSSPRVLVRLHLDGSAPSLPAPGDSITKGTRPRAVGRVGTVVQDCDFGPIALAVVKRSALQSQDLRVGDCSVAVDPETIPQDNGTKAGREAVQRFRSRTL
ncbi:folate-binding protein YgfZ [Corynebacterium sp. TAE3-ERU30]|uniref:CAF17-like 4Fe-4S cluster assembly/insertion protein YgfZ n=1 Tax=Corynebacterium sp. TAE3-ERU30 TaxID=2849496 RepID=UPI001C44FD4A|nr:folate-binding protein [Corynebacterium sp. TAE3-ERU30]MBV7282666.1 folate-binding protein [Corynebacterium sp. TAE3-ERU30]